MQPPPYYNGNPGYPSYGYGGYGGGYPPPYGNPYPYPNYGNYGPPPPQQQYGYYPQSPYYQNSPPPMQNNPNTMYGTGNQQMYNTAPQNPNMMYSQTHQQSPYNPYANNSMKKWCLLYFMYVLFGSNIRYIFII